MAVKSSTILRGEIAAQSFTWLEKEFSKFDPFYCGSTPSEAAQTALVEIALVAMTLSRRSPQLVYSKGTAAWLNFVASAYSRPAFYETLLRGHKHAFTGHLLLFAALTLAGIEPPVGRERLQTILDNDTVLASERLPYRLLELRYLLDLCSFSHSLPSLEAIGKRCFLRKEFNPIDVMDQDVYALTHATFYLSDFGGKPVPLGGCGRESREAVTMLLVMMAQRQHWDLVAELLLALYCLGNEENPLTDAIWNALARAQLSSGTIKTPAESHSVDDSDPHTRFLHLYHRNITALLASTLAWPAANR
jgi:hypothetical protein